MTFDPSDDTLLKVRIDVLDIDDNKPQFIKKVFTGGISTDTAYGSTVLTVHAFDPDTNGQVGFFFINYFNDFLILLRKKLMDKVVLLTYCLKIGSQVNPPWERDITFHFSN